MNDIARAGAGARAPSRIERLTAALAPATRESYRNGWRKWEAFALDHGATTLPADPEALAAFVEHLAGAKPATIRATLAAVSAAHRLAGPRRTPRQPPRRARRRQARRARLPRRQRDGPPIDGYHRRHRGPHRSHRVPAPPPR